MRNKVILVGNVGKDPEIKYMSNGGAVANFSLATTFGSGEKKKTEWHKCVAFEKTAEIVEKYITKGMRIYVEGRLQTREWEDKSQVRHYTTEVVVSDICMLGDRRDDDAKKPETKKPSINYDDDIPF